MQVGAFRLVSLLEQTKGQEVWIAFDSAKTRKVELTIARESDRLQFLADAQAKAKVTNEVFASVEILPEESGYLAYATEHLHGKTFAQLAARGETLQPRELSLRLKEISQALQELKAARIDQAYLHPQDIVLDAMGGLRLKNVAVGRAPKITRENRLELVAVFRALLQRGLPGSTRLAGLLDLIEGSSVRSPIRLKEIEQLSQKVHAELSSDHLTATVARPLNEAKSKRKKVIVAALVVVSMGLVAVPFVFKVEQVEPSKQETVLIPAGIYPTPSGSMMELPAFSIAACEVTIAEYAIFLGEWGLMTTEEKAEILPIELLGSSWSPLPEDWTIYYPLAQKGQMWKGRRMSVDCPVIGVDWWDATAYALWKGGRLPTRQEWWAASSTLPDGLVETRNWGPVGGPGPGPHDLGGNVAEWARGRSSNPAEPHLGIRFKVLGGSFESKEPQPMQQEWVDSPNFTRHDVGFRLVFDVEQ